MKVSIRSPNILLSSKFGVLNRGWLEGSLFNSYYPLMKERALLLSLDCSTLPLILTLYCWVLSKEASITIFWVFGMTRPGVERWSPRPWANTLLIRPMLIQISLLSPCNYNILNFNLFYHTCLFALQSQFSTEIPMSRQWISGLSFIYYTMLVGFIYLINNICKRSIYSWYNKQGILDNINVSINADVWIAFFILLFWFSRCLI